MSRSIKAEVTRYTKATTNEAVARGTRLQAVDALATVHSLKPAAISRVLFDVADDQPLTSRETSPVSHATTVARIARAINIDPQEGEPYLILATLHSISTGTVKRAALDAAVKSFAATLNGSVPLLPAIEEWVSGLLAVKKAAAPRATAAEKEEPQNGAPTDPTSVTPANVVAIPATIPELIAALGDAIDGIRDAADRDKFIALAKTRLAKSAVKRNADVTAAKAKVTEATAKRAA